jgi:hypothetical protein
MNRKQESIQQPFLLPFDEKKINCNEIAKLEAAKLKEKALNRWSILVPGEESKV